MLCSAADPIVTIPAGRCLSLDAAAHVTFPRYAAVTLAKIDGNLRRLGRKDDNRSIDIDFQFYYPLLFFFLAVPPLVITLPSRTRLLCLLPVSEVILLDALTLSDAANYILFLSVTCTCAQRWSETGQVWQALFGVSNCKIYMV